MEPAVRFPSYERSMMKRRFENEHPSASVWLFVETVPGPPNNFVPHRFRQVLVDSRRVQEVTEHHKILWPLVLPLLALLHASLLITGNWFLGQAGWGAGITRWWESQIDIQRKSRLEVFERETRRIRSFGLCIHVNVLALKRRFTPDRPKPSGMVESRLCRWDCHGVE
jgi:hypothetical protein